MVAEASKVQIRPAIAADNLEIFGLIQALATYENLTVTGSAANLADDLFGAFPAAEAIVAEDLELGKLVGFVLFFANYSTFLTRPGIHLEDLFVLPQYRRQGIGKSLIAAVAQVAIARNCARLEWSVLDWNSLAIDFYRGLGAEVLPDWRICRVTGTGLTNLAGAALAD
ncbi:MAG: GNAT family N-acetyltransferase [Pseudanabaenaceae cyanobacterium bins.68]|nr:GNAT family N-acetyltransferase [Pseudanabaenaceae cyanobacterium bins.68]